MNLHHLYVFCAVAKHKSFGKAADEINISQPAISQQVQKLEDSLEKKLVERKGKFFKLTNHGVTMFEYGKRIFKLADEAKKAISVMESYQERILIGTTIIPGLSYVLDYIADFIEEKGHINFDVKICSTNDELITNIIKNQIDIAIAYEGIILRDDVQTKKIAHDELVLVIPGKHPWANGQILSFEEVLTLPFIFLDHDFFIQQILEVILSGNRVNVVFQFDSYEMVKSAIIRGLGVSMLPLSLIKSELEHGQLAVANCNIFRIPRHIILMYKNNFQLSTITEDFIGFSNNHKKIHS